MTDPKAVSENTADHSGEPRAGNAPERVRLPLWPIRLTWLGLLSENLALAFWPFWSLAMVALGLLMIGLPEMVPQIALQFGAGLAAFGLIGTLGWGLWSFRLPAKGAALARVDATLTGRPIQTVLDTQAIGADDPASTALWQAHQARMAKRMDAARAVAPDVVLPKRDPYGLRLQAALVLAVGLLFGSLARVAEVDGLTGTGQALAAGPTWEGWIEAPGYTGLPTRYLADQSDGVLEVAEGSRLILRLYGEVGALTLRETISGQPIENADIDRSAPEQNLDITQNGALTIEGPGGRSWAVTVLPDMAPRVAIAAAPETSFEGQMSLDFEATDDYGIIGGTATISLDLAAVDRRFGLSLDPENRDALVSNLPLPIAGSRAEFTETLIEDFSQHPWAHLPVEIAFAVEDAAGQTGMAEPLLIPLPARRFFDPMAAAVIEQRRDLLWNRDNARRVAQIMRAISWKPEDRLFRDEGSYLQFREILRRLEGATPQGLTDETVTELAAALWDLAVQLEDGDIDDALERMQAAQERLSEAMRNGASEEEIAELMQELRDATQDYLRQLSRQAQQEQQDMDEFEQAENQNSMQMDMNDLQAMMDRIQELMEQGRMAEAQQALEELQQLMENMQVTQGQGQPSPGQQAMDDLAETLRDQQGLSDQAFRDLQEQFNPNANQGQSQQNEGRNGGEGRGQSHEGQNGQGQNGEGPGGQPGQEGQNGQNGQPDQGSLADRQQALRDELNRQLGNLPGQGSDAGDAAREALRRAERAMEGAEQSLRQNDLAGAIDQQAEAMDQLREGMRNLGEALAEAQREQQPGQGQADGNTAGAQRDPLGRNPGSGGALNGDDNMLQGEDVYRRARELLDEIRRRSGEGGRSEEELDYLKRLLDRF